MKSSEAVRTFRALRGWTQAEAAGWFGVSERTWRRWETRGAPRPVLKRIGQWARRTGAAPLRDVS